MENFSNRLLDRAYRPKFKVNAQEKDLFFLEKRPGTFKFSFKIKDGKETQLFGLTDQNQVPPRLSGIKYVTELEQEYLAALDVLAEFSHDKDIRGIDGLSVREIENFLRDDNITPSLPNSGASLYPLFDKFKKGLGEILDSDSKRPIGAKQSPNINRDYKRGESYFPYKEKTDYTSLNSNEKMLLLGKIIEDHIQAPLDKDAGGIYLIFADDGMVVIEYSGECRSCSSSLTSTMNFIQKVFQLETENPDLLVMTDS